MNKVLVKIFFTRIDECYETWIPLNEKIEVIINSFIKGINELKYGIYNQKNISILYNRSTGEYYNINSKVKDTNIQNGTELILI